MSELLAGAPHLPRFVLPARDLRDAALETTHLDVLVVGAGIAGLTLALSLPASLHSAVLLKGRAALVPGVDGGRGGVGGGRLLDASRDGSSGHAQGGVAAVFGADDATALHEADTLAAGAGLSEPAAVRVLVEGAPDAVRFLQAHGVRLDGDGDRLDLTREGGHSRRRVVHAGGDATGREIMAGLTAAALASGVRLVEDALLVDLLSTESGAICGALVLEGGRLRRVLARAVVLATGGYGQLYSMTTSPRVLTGDGLAAALRAGAEAADLEFVQFHPTAVALLSDPRPLASESLRGEGAVIRNQAGEAVMRRVGAPGDLAPRDVVSRTMALEMQAAAVEHLYLDATAIGAALPGRFPTFVAAARRAGVDPEREWVPVAPALHYVMGGVRTDYWGRTSLRGLYVLGEVASSGAHGANRLASNSLVEGVIFARRAAAILPGDLAPHEDADLRPDALSGAPRCERPWLRSEMTRAAGVLRSGDSLAGLLRAIAHRARMTPLALDVAEIEEANLTLVAGALVAAALRRRESRGAHFRTDEPETRPGWRCHQVISRSADAALVVTEVPLGASSGAACGRGPARELAVPLGVARRASSSA